MELLRQGLLKSFSGVVNQLIQVFELILGEIGVALSEENLVVRGIAPSVAKAFLGMGLPTEDDMSFHGSCFLVFDSLQCEKVKWI